MTDALFHRRPDGTFLPTDLARGPWSADALHGGPVGALLAMAAEAELAGAGVAPVRLTVELLRPVPVAPLTLQAEVVRPGRKVRLVAVRLLDGDAPVASASVLAIRTEPIV